MSYEVIITLPGGWGTVSYEEPDFASALRRAIKESQGLDGLSAHVEIKFKKIHEKTA